MQPTHDTNHDLLYQAIDAIRNESPLSGPTNELLTLTKRRVNDLEYALKPSPQVFERRSRSTQRMIWSGFAIAATLLIGFSIFEWIAPNRNLAFASMLEQIQSLRCVSMRVTQEHVGSRQMEGKIVMDDKHIRVEYFDGDLIHISDLESRKSVIIDNKSKTGQLSDVPLQAADDLQSPVEQLRTTKPEQAKLLGHERLGGRATEIYQVNKSAASGIVPAKDFQVWIDVETKLPARIVVQDTDPKSEMKIVLDAMDWSIDVPAARMAIVIPDGYSEVTTLVVRPNSAEPTSTLNAKANPKARLIAGGSVPRSIVWDEDGQHVTALVSDPETTAVQNRKPDAIQRWDITKPLMILSKKHLGGSALAGSRDGKTVAAVSGREIQLMNTLTQDIIKTYVSKLPLPYLSLNASGRFLAAGNADWLAERERRMPAGFIQVWDTQTDKLICEIKDDATTTFVALSSDGSKVMSSSNAGPIKLWQTSNGELLHVFDGSLRGAFSLDGQKIAIAKQQMEGRKLFSSIQLFDLSDFRSLTELSMPTVASSILSLTYSSDGRSLAAGSWDGQLIVWPLGPKGLPMDTSTPRIENVGSGVHTLAFSPDGTKLASGSEDGALQVWDVK